MMTHEIEAWLFYLMFGVIAATVIRFNKALQDK